MRVGVALAIIAVVIIGMAWWWYVYTADLPNIAQLAEFVPAQRTMVSDPCTLSANLAVPLSEINENIRKASAASERPATDPGFARYVAFDRVYCPFVNEPREITTGEQTKLTLKAERLKNHLAGRFTSDQLLAIHLNSYRFGYRQIGVETAAQQVFHKPASSLELEEAALLFVRGNLITPRPDLLLQQRNGLLDIMRERKLITPQEAADAKSKPVPTIQK